jgi:hypothetical protein
VEKKRGYNVNCYGGKEETPCGTPTLCVAPSESNDGRVFGKVEIEDLNHL